MKHYLVFLNDCQFSQIEADDFEYVEVKKELWFMNDKEVVAFFNTNQIIGFKKMDNPPDEAPIFPDRYAEEKHEH